MVVGEPRTRRHPLRLEPDEDLHAELMRVVADRLEAVGEPLGIDLPSTDLRPALLLDIPAGVHPPIVQLYAAFSVQIEVHDLARLVGAHHLAVSPAAAGQRHRRWQLAAGPG